METTEDNLQKETEVTVQKMAEGSVEGLVSCKEGPVANASVSIGIVSTFTDAAGSFLLEHLPPGIEKVRVKSPLSRFYDSTTDVIIEADQKKNLSIFLTEITGVLEGTITDESGNPLVGAEVSGLFRLGKDPITTKTDEKGHYIFEDVPRGAYYIRARAHGFMTEGADVNITAGGNIKSDFSLKAANLSINGMVATKEGATVNCEIYLMRKGIVVTRSYVSKGSVGKYSFPDLVPDYYEIGILAPGYLAKGWGGKLEKPEVVNFELDVMPETNADLSYNH